MNENCNLNSRRTKFTTLQSFSKFSADLKRDMEKTEEVLCIEIEKRLTNGEPFDIRIARIQKDFEDSFNKILKSELGRVSKSLFTHILVGEIEDVNK